MEEYTTIQKIEDQDLKCELMFWYPYIYKQFKNNNFEHDDLNRYYNKEMVFHLLEFYVNNVFKNCGCNQKVIEECKKIIEDRIDKEILNNK